MFYPILFFIFGLFWGSFLNNIAYRLKTGEDFFFLRSKCPSCQTVLSPKELIPILSFIFLKGKCLHCQTKISLRYPLTEIFTGLWVFILYLKINPLINFNFFLIFLFYFLLLSGIFVLALYDLDTFLVDDRILIFLLVIGIIFNVLIYFQKLSPLDFSYIFNYFLPFPFYLQNLFSAFLFSSFLFLFYLLTKGEGLGFGDVKTIFVIGLFFKPGDMSLILVFSSFLGSLYGIYLLIKNKKFKIPIPFVPFMFLGIVSLFIFGKILTFNFFNIY